MKSIKIKKEITYINPSFAIVIDPTSVNYHINFSHQCHNCNGNCCDSCDRTGIMVNAYPSIFALRGAVGIEHCDKIISTLQQIKSEYGLK